MFEISKTKNETAIKYLKKSVKLNSHDAQVYYNLAGAYLLDENYNSALNAIDNCLIINPNFKGAKNLQKQLFQAVKK